MLYFLSAIYILLSASGLVLFKMGSQKEMGIGISAGFLSFKISIVSLLGMLCYIMSFLMYLFLVSKFDLNKIYPITTGCIFVCVMLGSFLVLKENIGTIQIVGSALILIGVVLLAIKH